MFANHKINFTKATLNSLPLPAKGKRIYYYDTKTRGLGISITSSGTKSFVVYRWVNSKPERVTIGRYVAYLQHPPQYYSSKLVGIHEAHNSLNGYPVKPPLLFGNKERALAVLQGGKEIDHWVYIVLEELETSNFPAFQLAALNRQLCRVRTLYQFVDLYFRIDNSSG